MLPGEGQALRQTASCQASVQLAPPQGPFTGLGRLSRLPMVRQDWRSHGPGYEWEDSLVTPGLPKA